MQKTNPRRKPATQADCRKQFEKGVQVGCHACLAMVIFTLVDNELMDNEQMAAFNKRFNSVVECVRNRNLDIKDLEEILVGEYNWEVI